MYCVWVVVVGDHDVFEPADVCDGKLARLIGVIFPWNRLLVKKHCVCELDFYSEFHLVPWDVLTAFLCGIVECALLLLLRIFEGIFRQAVRWGPAMWRRSCFLLWISVWVCLGSTARDGEKCTDRLLIWTRIDYRQSEAQEFLLPSYFYFFGF